MYEFTNMRLNLQLFGGEGASAGTGDSGGEGTGAATVVTAADDGQQRLRELGVPEELLKKRAKSTPNRTGKAKGMATPAAAASVPEAAPQDAAANTPPVDTEAGAQAAAKKLTFAEQMEADPEFKDAANQYARGLIQARVKEENSSKAMLDKLAPLLQHLADKHGQDIEHLDIDALTRAVADDVINEESLKMGTSRETTEQLIQQRHDDKRAELQRKQQAEQQRTQQEEQNRRAHFDNLMQQGNKLKETYPQFDLMEEIKNPLFVALTQPHMLQMGATVEQAYRTVHQKEIDAMQSQRIAQETTQKVTNAIRAGQSRPVENGTSGKAPSVTTFDYKNATKQQREDFKKQIFAAAARGEKIYPGQGGPR